MLPNGAATAALLAHLLLIQTMACPDLVPRFLLQRSLMLCFIGSKGGMPRPVTISCLLVGVLV